MIRDSHRNTSRVRSRRTTVVGIDDGIVLVDDDDGGVPIGYWVDEDALSRRDPSPAVSPDDTT